MTEFNSKIKKNSRILGSSSNLVVSFSPLI